MTLNTGYRKRVHVREEGRGLCPAAPERNLPGSGAAGPDAAIRRRPGPAGFTLLEVLLSITILSVVSSVTFMAFSAASLAWQRGTALADRLHHGDFVMNQLVMGLRSAYYPDAEGDVPAYGFQHRDRGDGAGAQDEISWVKLGGALVGRDQAYAESPHRVRFLMADDASGRRSAAVVSWRLEGQPDDFDPDVLPPVFLSNRVDGFTCRAAWEMNDDGEWDWQDEWSETNRLPRTVEITLYIEPVAEGMPPIELKRILRMRVAEQIWIR